MRAERGQAMIEVMVVGVLLLIPLLWLLGVLSELHRGALAATAAVREAGADAVRSGDAAEAERAVRNAVEQAFKDHRLDSGNVRVRWSGRRLERGGAVEVRVSYPVRVFQIPLLGGLGGPSVWINARHVARLDPFRSR